MLIKLENITFMIALVGYLIASGCFFAFMALKKEKCAKIGNIVMLAAFIVHSASIVIRGIAAGRLPLTNQFEFATAFAWGIALCFLIFVKKFNFASLGAFVAPIVFLIIGYASMQSREIHELMPALQSNWLAFHVCTAIIAYGSFGVAFGVSLVYLCRDKFSSNEFLTGHFPDFETLDLISYRVVALGFLFLTLCMITGAIWAKRAWGTYWNWDPKETWSLITWLIYSIFLHLRTNKGWKGKKAAIFAVVGFLCVVFTYVGVNTLLSGLHSYA